MEPYSAHRTFRIAAGFIGSDTHNTEDHYNAYQIFHYHDTCSDHARHRLSSEGRRIPRTIAGEHQRQPLTLPAWTGTTSFPIPRARSREGLSFQARRGE